MKKIIRILGVTLSLVVLASCSKDNDNGSLPEVSPSSISGTYKIVTAGVPVPVDFNKDKIFNGDLFQEDYNICNFDNHITISAKTFTDVKKGVACVKDETDVVYDYVLDVPAKTLKLYKNGVLVETFTDVVKYLENTLQYDRFDPVLKQKVFFQLTKV